MEMTTTINRHHFTNFLNSGALLRWGDSWHLFWGLSDKIPIGPESVKSNGIYSCDYVNKQFFHQNFENFAILDKSEFGALLREYKTKLLPHKGHRFLLSPQWEEIDKTPFSESFCRIKKAISEGKIQKAVPFNFQFGHVTTLSGNQGLTSEHKLQLLARLIEADKSLIPYAQWDENNGFMGVTPELFFSIEDQVLTTMALAATSDKKVPREVFLNDPKELKEHQLVIADIQEKLKSFGTLAVGESYVFELPHLNHLRTDIQVKLDAHIDFYKILQTLHPTSALGIYPNNEYWKEFIQLPLQNLRAGFGAPWGFHLNGSCFFVVGIRRLEWMGSSIRIPAGCGVVELSDLDKECAEVERKINSVKKMFFPQEEIIPAVTEKEISVHE